MPIVIEKEGKTASEAILTVCEELGVARDEIDVEVLKEGSRGVLGIGSKDARVRVTVKREDVSEKGLRSRRILEEILKFFISNYSVNLRETTDAIKLDVKSGDEDKGALIGKRGDTLKAMEFLVGKIGGKSCEDGREKRVYIDIDGYKKRRERTIAKMVKEAARKVRKFGRPITLDPMPAFERKIAYTALKHENGIRIETKDEGEEKRITINPTRQGGGRNQAHAQK
ncbi:MAG TPA: RNA-binding cell elongation regulator Jag/EloR [Thermodesulfobacteriota bacterium]|nr:RNA-binding cell elongation regulator Jag/EloR [Thermodesulfobacteriota bacterium]